MAEVNITTQGFKELQRAFKAMPPAFANTVLVSGVNAAAKMVRDAAKQAAPRYDGPYRSAASLAYGRLSENIKFKTLRKRNNVSRAAVVTRGRAFWGEFINRGSRYIAATRWYDKALAGVQSEALATMRSQMVKKMNSLADNIIRKSGAGRK